MIDAIRIYVVLFSFLGIVLSVLSSWGYLRGARWAPGNKVRILYHALSRIGFILVCAGWWGGANRIGVLPIDGPVHQRLVGQFVLTVGLAFALADSMRKSER
jgi:hypothetical protein